jgi:hypothetical protein
VLRAGTPLLNLIPSEPRCAVARHGRYGSGRRRTCRHAPSRGLLAASLAGTPARFIAVPASSRLENAVEQVGVGLQLREQSGASGAGE